MTRSPAIVSIVVFLTFAQMVAVAEDGHQGDVQDVVTVDTLDKSGPYKRIWEPFLARWSDQHYMCTYGLELRGKSDMGDIVCSISLDRGKTWGPRVMVFDHRQREGSLQYAYNNSVLFRPPGQDVVWIFAMRAPLHYRDSENADLVAAYTPDGGYTWHPVEVSNGYQGPLIIVAGIEAVQRDGVTHFLLPAHRNSRRHDPYGDRRQFVLESTSLVKWNLAGYIPYEDDSPIFLHEGKIAPTENDGEIKIVMRTATMDRERPLPTPLAYSSISRDGGKTWSTAQPDRELPNHRAKSFFGRDSNGKYIYVYSDQFERRGMSYKTRPTGGSWSEAKVFYFRGNRNSYPTLVEESPGRWAAVWDSSNSPDDRRTAIRFGRLTVQ